MDGGLCDELLEEILHRLPPRSTFSPNTSDISLVSKRWLRLYRSSRSTLSLRLIPDLYCNMPRSLSSFLSHFPHLSSLSITASLDFPDHFLLSVVSSFPNMTALCLKSKPLSLFPLLSLSTSCPHLTSLSISLSRPFSFHCLLSLRSLENLSVSFNSVPDESEHVDAELKLETLYLSGILRGDRGLDWLWRSCKNLKKLQLCCCEEIGDDMLRSSFVDCLKGLQEVELIQCRPLLDDFLSKLGDNCASLSSLLVRDHFYFTKELCRFVTRSCCNLRKLDLRIRRGYLRENHLLAMAEKFRGLSSLRLHSFCHFGQGLNTMMLAMSHELEELALVDCYMKLGLLTTLGQKFRNVRKLDLSSWRMPVDQQFSSTRSMLVEEKFISMLASYKCLTEWRV